MPLIVQKEIYETFDHPVIGVIDCRGIDNTDNTGNTEEVQAMLRIAEADTRRMFSRYESHGLHPHPSAWRKAYKQFGADPHQYRCSAESLVRRVLKGDSVPHINTLVDIYNYISLKYVIPVGGEDTDAIRGDVQLAFADGTERFIRLNGTENEPPLKGEVVYKDDEGVLCRRWNWREADRTKLSPETTNAVIVLDGLAPLNRAEMEDATQELSDLIGKFCGGTQKRILL